MSQAIKTMPNSLGGDPKSPVQGKAQFKLGAQMKKDGDLDIYLYGEVESGYYDWWTSEYHESETSAEYFKRILFDENPTVKTINLFINSIGGSVYEGTAIANMLRRHPATVNVTVDGVAYSVASVIAMAGDYVTMPRNAMMMIHNATVGAWGNANDLRAVADYLDKTMEASRTIYLDKAGDKLTDEQLIELLDAETFLTAEECLEYGFCDEIAGSVTIEDSTLTAITNSNERLAEMIKDRKSMVDQVKALDASSVTVSVDTKRVPGDTPVQKETYFQKLFNTKETK